MPSFYEFFAGAGMVRAGLGPGWHCQFANDIDVKKCATYALNWGADSLKIGDVRDITTVDLPHAVDLVWASFPCQDLSLAGSGAGLGGNRSGTFWPFWGVVSGLIEKNQAPKIIAVENVCGTITSRKGQDFAAICKTFANAGYRYGALIVDAKEFVPQSRPRLFIVGIRNDVRLSVGLASPKPSDHWHTAALRAAHRQLSPEAKKSWVWWSLPKPSKRHARFANLVEQCPKGVKWHSSAQTAALIAMMSDINRAKLDAAIKLGRRTIGTVYKRTRKDSLGRKVQRAEVRFDDLAGCLRTPGGGSSRQTIVIVESGEVRSRLISPRETARLMGLPDDYKLPANANEAYHLTGDGVAVPVVRHLALHLFEPTLAQGRQRSKRIAA
jgi:DNA (cytosine-5)-methyltransferase 1